MVAKERLEFLQINLGSDIKPAVGRKQSIRDNRMQMGMEVHQIANGLHRHNHPGNSTFSSQWGLKEDFQTFIRALAEFPQ